MRSKRSKSFLAAEAVAACAQAEEWQLGETEAGLAQLGAGEGVDDEKVSKWLGSWGQEGETKAPRRRRSDLPVRSGS
jgi:predicted transcriptional regulator